MKRQVCEWPDFLGQPIHHGDRLRHPGGETFIAVYTSPGPAVDGYNQSCRPWRALYDGDVRVTSDLGLQIGDKGQAVVIESYDS